MSNPSEPSRPRRHHASRWLQLGFVCSSYCAALLGCDREEGALLGAPSNVDAGTSKPSASAVPESSEEPDAAAPSSSSAPATTDPVPLPGEPFGFDLLDEVYIRLNGPEVVTGTSRDRTNWDLRFEGFGLFTNGGASGAGEGASFGPSTDLDLLFDTAPDVPMRADLSDGALMKWYWFGEAGIASRYHVYGLRDADGHLFKVQILGYYAEVDSGLVSAQYTLRYAEVTEDGIGETKELAGIDATAGGVSAPAGALSACVNLEAGDVHLWSEDEWSRRDDWHVCFARTDAIVNGGVSGPGAVVAVDLDLDPATGEDPGLTEEESVRTADSELDRFNAIGYEDLNASHLAWDKQYDVVPRIGTRWVQGSSSDPSPVPGTWFVRGADGSSYYALYFTSVTREGSSPPRVELQVKALNER